MSTTSPTTSSSLWPKVAEANGLTLDVLSFGRNGTNAGALFYGADAAAKVASAVGGLAIVGGVLGVVSGLNLLNKSSKKLSKAHQTKNLEGGVEHASASVAGASFATLSGGLIATNAATFAGATAAAATAGIAITGSGFVLYGIIGLWAGYGISVNHSFRNTLQSKLNSQQDEGKQLASALEWLISQVGTESGTPEMEKKSDQFAFRTNEACCKALRQIASKQSTFLDALRRDDPVAIAEAQRVIQEVKRANAKQLMKHYIFMAIALLGVAAFVCAILFATGPFAPLLFAIGTIGWILLDSSKLHETLGNKLFGKSEQLTISTPPGSDLVIPQDVPNARKKSIFQTVFLDAFQALRRLIPMPI